MPKELPATPDGPEVVDPTNVPVVFTDWIITGGHSEGVYNLALGTVDHSLNLPDAKFGCVIVATRIRCSHAFLMRLHKVLSDAVGNPPTETDQSPVAPPKSLLN